MTDLNPSTGNAPAYPADAVAAYLNDRQTDAMHLEGLLEVLDHLDNEGTCRNGMTTIIMLARRIAADLNRDLDSIHRPEIGGVA